MPADPQTVGLVVGSIAFVKGAEWAVGFVRKNGDRTRPEPELMTRLDERVAALVKQGEQTHTRLGKIEEALGRQSNAIVRLQERGK
ncbi:MAG: hypothetical protein ACYTEQ_01330 [Planctomycetota bacterium]|jgi:hypothetical protein